MAYSLPLWLVAEMGRSTLSGSGIAPQYFVTVGIVAVVLLLSPPDVPLLLYALFLTGMIAFLALCGQSIDTERLRGEVLRAQALTDSLAGTLNRRGGGQQLNEVLARPGCRAAALLLDLDRFKGINDRHGHALGDEVLIAVAHAAQGTAGPAATVTRWGGEEFLMVWPDLAPPEASAAADQILAAVRALTVGEVRDLTLSAGLAFASEAQERDGLVNPADRRMYAAKSMFKNPSEFLQLSETRAFCSSPLAGDWYSSHRERLGGGSANALQTPSAEYEPSS